ncbi:hypothetical protein GOZ94_11085 [Agrobacterium vitis]|uniref:type I restriction enzyme HsdR N-terminal domain-containing protein n=1 Tax=Agrobacterium vitis TaxID=373 RepID=UPI0012E76F04|nr:type I restriction enzyme HsdR N-terminal domain-containing protein [Agrobacterium vitis]MVA19492.1 hypothetical protein [Agrobacterium vitis]
MKIIEASKLTAAPKYNETEIRFHILDPIIRRLGYDGGDNVYLLLENQLEYPYFHIGRRNKKKDLPLGFPDYLAGLTGARGSFVIEAKAGNVPITPLEIEQAHSYAAHAQVGARYFVLCNGLEITVFETLSGFDKAPLTRVPLLEINERFHELANILSPASLEKNCTTHYDTKLKLCDGLGSSVRIASGAYRMDHYSYKAFIDGQDCTSLLKASVPQFAKVDSQLDLLKTTFELRVASGLIRRDDNGRIISNVEFAGVTVHSAEAMRIMGTDHASFVTDAKFISTEANDPTNFDSLRDFAIPKGTAMPELFGNVVQMQDDVSLELLIRTAIFFDGTAFQGDYLALGKYNYKLPTGQKLVIDLDLSGTLKLQAVA